MYEKTFSSINSENQKLIGEMNLYNMYVSTPVPSTADFLRSKTSDNYIQILVDEHARLNIVNDEPLR